MNERENNISILQMSRWEKVLNKRSDYAQSRGLSSKFAKGYLQEIADKIQQEDISTYIQDINASYSLSSEDKALINALEDYIKIDSTKFDIPLQLSNWFENILKLMDKNSKAITYQLYGIDIHIEKYYKEL